MVEPAIPKSPGSTERKKCENHLEIAKAEDGVSASEHKGTQN